MKIKSNFRVFHCLERSLNTIYETTMLRIFSPVSICSLLIFALNWEYRSVIYLFRKMSSDHTKTYYNLNHYIYIYKHSRTDQNQLFLCYIGRPINQKYIFYALRNICFSLFLIVRFHWKCPIHLERNWDRPILSVFYINGKGPTAQ